MIKLLVEDNIFDYQFNKRSNKSKFINLYYYKVIFIAIRILKYIKTRN